jgi:Ca-activated chloride channel homolog
MRTKRTKRGRAFWHSRGRLLLRVLAVGIVIAVLWDIWGQRQKSSSQPPALAYGEQPTRNDWPALEHVGESFSDPRDLLKSNYYVILDGSQEMAQRGCSSSGSKLDDAVQALAAFIDAVPEDANVGIMAMNQGKLIELAPLQGDVRINPQTLARLGAAGGAPLRSAIFRADEQLTRQAQRQLGYGEYHLVVISGGAVTPGEEPFDIMRRLLDESPLNLHVISLCGGANDTLNVAALGIFYHAADNYAALQQALGEVLEEPPAFSVENYLAPSAVE